MDQRVDARGRRCGGLGNSCSERDIGCSSPVGGCSGRTGVRTRALGFLYLLLSKEPVC